MTTEERIKAKGEGRNSSLILHPLSFGQWRALWFVRVLLLLTGLLGAEGANYLIITDDQFAAAIRPLAEWRQQKGMITRVVKLSELPSPRRTDIRDYIVNAWQNWSPRPEYVLLVGDVQHLPVGQTSPVNSDNYYANTDDHFKAELCVGRFPCRTETECQTMVAKTLAYERWPAMDDTAWFRRGTIAVRFDNAGDTVGYYVQDLHYVTGIMRDSAGFVVDSLFWREGEGWHNEGPDNASRITDAVNEGRAWLLFRGIGADDNTYEGWNPPMNVHPESTRNGTLLPVVYGGCCQTVFVSRDRGVGEAWLRAGSATDPCGAVAYLGNSIHSTASMWRSKVIQGFFKSAFIYDTLTLGKALFWGKDSLYRWMEAHFGPDTVTDSVARYVEQSIMGDPALQLWTDAPHEIAVTFPPLVQPGPGTLRVAVTGGGLPQAGALVCAERDSEFFSTGRTDSAGEVVLAIDPRTSGWFPVTVTGRNLHPFEGQCEVASRDVGVMAIVAPAGMIDSGATVCPVCSVENFGSSDETYTVRMRIGGSYEEAVTVPAHAPHTRLGLAFPDWTADCRGPQVVSCSTELSVDTKTSNDRWLRQIVVHGADVPCWQRIADLPAGDRGKLVKDGGCLAYGTQSGEGFVYALKGNRTNEFYRYSVFDNAWQSLETIPGIGASGHRKLVGRGACLVCAGGSVYAAKGGNTIEWWQYEPKAYGSRLTAHGPDSGFRAVARQPSAASGWVQQVAVPAGAKRLNEGTGAVTVSIADTDFIYFLKGTGTLEFYRLNTRTGIWATMPSAPPGLSAHGFRDGSVLAFDGDRTIYALKGKWNEFFAFDVESSCWTTRASLPVIGGSGHKKYAKSGAALAWLDGAVHALKGNNSGEYWCYSSAGDSWSQGPDVPIGGGRRVKGGGSLAASDLMLYALKGNNSLEFYVYGLTAAFRARQAAGGGRQATGGLALAACGLQLGPVAPNPVSRLTNVRYVLPEASDVRLKLYDVTGKLAATVAAGLQGPGPAGCVFDPSAYALSPGPYFLKLEIAGASVTRKIIVESGNAMTKPE